LVWLRVFVDEVPLFFDERLLRFDELLDERSFTDARFAANEDELPPSA